MTEQPEHVIRNRAAWDEWAADYVDIGRQNWAASDPAWGVWGVAESELRMLEEPLADRDAIELGCGTAYASAWMERRGARVVAIDNSTAQLATALELQDQYGLEFELIQGDAEQVPMPDQSFDFALSEYGASIWCDPYAWIPEAARLLRPGGRLVFLVNSPLVMICTPDSDDGAAAERLVRPYFGLHRIEWPGDESIEFHLPHGELIRLLRESGFEVEELIEVRPPPGATTRYPWIDIKWARSWPCEEVWKVRRRG